MISGTVDGFMAGGESKDWSVELTETVFTTTAGFDTDSDDAALGTIWTIGDRAEDTAGDWSGQMHDPDGGTPQTAVGVFSAEYGVIGRMVGGFGANHD